MRTSRDSANSSLADELHPQCLADELCQSGVLNQSSSYSHSGGFSQSGFSQSGFSQSGFSQSGFSQSGFSQSGYSQSGVSEARPKRWSVSPVQHSVEADDGEAHEPDGGETHEPNGGETHEPKDLLFPWNPCNCAVLQILSFTY